MERSVTEINYSLKFKPRWLFCSAFYMKTEGVRRTLSSWTEPSNAPNGANLYLNHRKIRGLSSTKPTSPLSHIIAFRTNLGRALVFYARPLQSVPNAPIYTNYARLLRPKLFSDLAFSLSFHYLSQFTMFQIIASSWLLKYETGTIDAQTADYQLAVLRVFLALKLCSSMRILWAAMWPLKLKNLSLRRQPSFQSQFIW